MKLKSILFAAVAALVTLSACKKEVQVPAGLTVDQSAVKFTATGGTPPIPGPLPSPRQPRSG